MKRIMSLMLTLVLVFVGTVPATADTIDVNLGVELENVIEQEIAQRKVQEYESIYRQLQMQDAVYMLDVYTEMVDPMIELEVKMKYGDTSVAMINSDDTGFPNGCIVGYEHSSLYTKHLSTYLDYNNSYYFVLTNGSTINTIVMTILGMIPNWGYAFSPLFGLAAVANNVARQSIVEADGRAMIMNASEISGLQPTTVVTGWSTFPYCPVPSAATNLNLTVFPYHNPFA